MRQTTKVVSKYFIFLAMILVNLVQTNASAQSYPQKPITIIVPFGPGGSGDIMARSFAQYLEGVTKQPVIVDNKPGADGIVGTEFVKNASPDGYTLLLTTNTTMAANLYFYKKVPYDPLKDFSHIGLFGTAASVALVPKDSPINTIPELVAAAKADPNKYFFGHYNSASRMTAELLKVKSGAPLTGIPYKAIGTALQDFYGGQTQVIFIEYLPAKAQLDGGKVKPLAVSGLTRFKNIPNVPAISEYYPGYELGFYLALAAPAGIPPDVLQALNGYMNSAMNDPAFLSKMDKLWIEPGKLNHDQFQKFVVNEKNRWGTIVRDAGIQPQ